MAKNRVVITGMGIYSPLGKGLVANHTSLYENRHGISNISILQTRLSDILPAGEIKCSNDELRAGTRFTSNYIPRSVLLSTFAIEEALDQAGLLAHKNIDLYYATTVGGIDISENLVESRLQRDEVDYAGFQYHDCGASSSLLGDYYGFTGRRYAISTACSSSANCIGKAAQDILTGKSMYALAGGADALCRFTLNGFNSLMILDKDLSNPMDNRRRGLNLGEAAAFLTLESETNAIERGATILGYVSGYGNTNDSHHQTASSEVGIGAQLAMRAALEDAGLQPKDISYINAHGTGTINNDLSEGNAVQEVFEKVPPIASTKSYTGHTLAASGSVEAIFSVLSLQYNEVYPSLRFGEAIEGHRFASFSECYSTEVQHVLSNALGFGGNCSSLIFSKA